MPETMPAKFSLLFHLNEEDRQAAIAQVYLCLSSPGTGQDCEQRILLSRQCSSVQELRREIDRLQKELEYLWHAGRRSFSDFEQLKKSQLAQVAS